MTTHKIGDLVMRVRYHAKWNKHPQHWGIIVGISENKDGYTVHWFDDHNLVMSALQTYGTEEISKYKKYVDDWDLVDKMGWR